MKNRLTLYLLFQVTLLCGQQGFIKSYNFEHQSAVRFTSLILDNDTLLLGGIIKDTLPPYEQGFFLSKVDTTGEILKTKIYFDSTVNSYTTGDFPGNLIKTLDNTGYIFAGNMKLQLGF